MAPKPDKKSATAAREQLKKMGIEYVDEWEGWKTGDRCGIDTEAGEFVIQGFRVLDGILDAVTVVGGPVWGQEATREFRSFKPEKLSKTIRKAGKKPKDENGED